MTLPRRPVPTRRASATTIASAALLGALLPAAGAAAAPAVERSAKIADGLYEIVVSPSTGTVYVASVGRRGENNAQVLALDGETLSVTGSIDVSANPGFGLGLNDATQTLYTTNTRSGSVLAIDLATGEVTTIAREGETHVREAVVDQAANRVYVSDVGGRGEGVLGDIWVIDGATNTLSHVIEDLGPGITGLALDAEDGRLYATSMGANEVVVVDLGTEEVVGRFPSGGETPTNVAVDPATDRLFVTNQDSGTLAVLDARDGEVLATVPTGERALGVTVDPARNVVYVANRDAGTVTVIDATSYQVLADLPTGTHPNTVAVNPGTGVAYVSNKAMSGERDAPPVDDPNGDTVSVIVP